MARIPDASQIQLQISSGAQSVSTARPSTRDPFIAFGAVAGEVAEALEKKREIDDKYNLKRAAIEYKNGLYKLEDEYKEDDDYATLRERHDKAVGDLRERIESGVRLSKQAQMEWELITAEESGRSMSRVGERAWSLERDYHRGELSRQLTEIRERAVALDDPAEFLGMVADAETLLQAAEDKGYVTQEQYQALLTETREGIATAKFDTLEPENKLAATQTEWFRMLPLATQAKLKREAEREGLASLAQTTLNAYKARGLSDGEIDRRLDEVDDPRLQRELRSQHEDQIRRRNLLESQQQEDVMEEYFLDLKEDRITLDQILASPGGRAKLRLLSPTQYAQLEAAEKGDSQYPSSSDPTVIDALNQALYSGAPDAREQARKIFDANRMKLNESAFNFYSAATSGKQLAGEKEVSLKTLKTGNKLIMEKTASLIRNKNDAKRAAQVLQDQLNSWYMHVQRTEGREPSPAEINEQAQKFFDNPRTIIEKSGWVNRTFFNAPEAQFAEINEYDARIRIQDAIDSKTFSIDTIRELDPQWLARFRKFQGDAYRDEDAVDTYLATMGIH